jgi:1-acyl-sn-glycerol-3-phosphate acyltransferase
MNRSEAQTVTEARRRGSFFTRLRSYCFFVPLVYLFTGVFGAVALLCSFFDRGGRVQHRIARLWARSILKAVGIRVQVHGRERLQDCEPAIYAANHLSAVDIPVLYSEIPGQFRIMAKKQLFRYPFLGGYLKRSGQIPIVLGDAHASLRSLNRACDALRKGMPLVVFPEGGRSETGQLKEFMGGAFYVAIRAQAPVIPVAIVGSYELLPINSFHAIPGVVELAFGEPVPTAGLRLRDSEPLAARVRQEIAELYASHAAQKATNKMSQGTQNPMLSTQS